MKFLANENFPVLSFQILKSSGLDIEHIIFTNPSVSDEEVMSIAIAQSRVIITFDRDYGELVYRFGYKPLGVIYLRFKEFEPDFPGRLILDLLESGVELEGLFTVIDPNKMRQNKI